MGKNHLRILQRINRSTLHTIKVCDSDKSKKVDYTDYKIAINEFKPTNVIIAAPTPLHEEMLDYCIKKEVPSIFVEKPIIANGNAEKYLDRNIKSRIMVGHIERYNPIVNKLSQWLKGKEIDTIICTRSGLLKVEEDLSVDIDLCIHDADVCQLLTRDFKEHLGGFKFNLLGKDNKSNSCNILANINGVNCFLHADNKSSYKRREIKIIGPGYEVEGDYINQRIWINGKEETISKTEPLEAELIEFFNNNYNIDDLMEAINNLIIVGMI